MNVTVLKLHVPESPYVLHDNRIFMPGCLYTSKTLEVLEICLFTTKTLSIDVPLFVCLPKLTSLKLESVNYLSDESVRRLISGCPSLEQLNISRCVFDGVRTFTLDSPTLKSLNYYFITSKGFTEHDFKLELSAPALSHLYLDDLTSRDFSALNLCSLEHAEIHVSSPKAVDIDSHCQRVVQLMQIVHNVSHLWISGDTLEDLRHPPAPSISSIYIRDSLLIMDTNDIYLQEFLECSDNFGRHLFLSKDSSDTTHVVQWRAPEELPVCLLSYLETISVSGFRGRKSELSIEEKF